MKFLANAIRPDKKQYKENECPFGYSEWYNQFIIGEPKAVSVDDKTLTVEELKNLGFVGLYAPDNRELTGTIDRILNGQLYEIKTNHKVR